MDNIKIFKKVIEKAVKNGYKYPLESWYESTISIEENGIIDNGGWYEFNEQYHLNGIIFSHDFAKAFWGIESHSYYKGGFDCMICMAVEAQTDYCWEHHLQQMVLETEPLKYLEKFLE